MKATDLIHRLLEDDTDPKSVAMNLLPPSKRFKVSIYSRPRPGGPRGSWLGSVTVQAMNREIAIENNQQELMAMTDREGPYAFDAEELADGWSFKIEYDDPSANARYKYTPFFLFDGEPQGTGRYFSDQKEATDCAKRWLKRISRQHQTEPFDPDKFSNLWSWLK